MKIIKCLIILLLLMLPYKAVAPAKPGDYIMKLKDIEFYNYAEKIRYNEELNSFINKLGFDESRNNWLAVNKIGAIGEFQFMERTLRQLDYGHITLAKFKEDPTIFPPELQREALKELIEYNLFIMRNFFEYENTIIEGVLITRAGLLAACHLGGPKSVQLFLTSSGKINKKDVLGTSIKDYMNRYQIFDLTLNLK